VLLGAFAKIAKGDYQRRRVCTSIAKEIWAPTGQIFMGFDLFVFFFENISK
jgi:hypothetical protein